MLKFFTVIESATKLIFSQREKELKEQHEKGGAQFFYDIEANLDEEDPIDRGGRRKRQGGDFQPRQPAKQLAPDSCWFCLSNVDAEKHLIVTVGNLCYMAMPKGPLTDDHVMVMSIGKNFENVIKMICNFTY